MSWCVPLLFSCLHFYWWFGPRQKSIEKESWQGSTDLEWENGLESHLHHCKLCDLGQVSWSIILSISPSVKWRQLFYLLIHGVLVKMRWANVHWALSPSIAQDKYTTNGSYHDLIGRLSFHPSVMACGQRVMEIATQS